MRLDLALALPRDQRSVPVTRHAVRAILPSLGVTEACTSDVEVALSEACTNVLDHAPPAAQYEVRLHLTDQRCVLQVAEVPPGQASRVRGGLPADGVPAPEAEHGCGLLLMRALVDRVGFRLLPGAGPVVSLEKRLTYDHPGHPGPQPNRPPNRHQDHMQRGGLCSASWHGAVLGRVPLRS